LFHSVRKKNDHASGLEEAWPSFDGDAHEAVPKAQQPVYEFVPKRAE
jgi:hypothetical protein